MADHNKGGFISKAQKKLTRTKTKVLQNLGKAEKTSDERFDEHVHKLDKQQEVAHRFQKELRNYIHCAKAMEVASKSFYNVLSDTYEEAWKDQAKLRETLQSLELMWSDYIQHLQESVQDPLNTYTSHFAPLKQRIAKRNRKLDYFDNARHNSDVQQNAKKKDEVKITKANEELEESKRIYEVLNNELHNELPEFFNSRVNFYANTFKSFFNAECTFHGETGKLNDTAMSIADTLAEDHKQYTYQPRPLSGIMGNEEPVVNGHSSGDNDSNHSNNPIPSKQEKISPKPERPPSSPGSKVRTPSIKTEIPSGSETTPVKSNIEGTTNGLSSEPDSPPESPLYENSELTAAKVETATTDISKAEDDDDDDDSYEEPVLNAKPPVVNGPSEEEVKSEIKEVKSEIKEVKSEIKEEVKSEIKEEIKSDPAVDTDVDKVPSYPPPQPPEPPKDDIPEKSTESVENQPADEESDHYYDKVPDQLDEKDDDDHDDNLYEIPRSSKIDSDEMPDGCLFVALATHLYKNEDDDELMFEAGELIYVVPFDDPDDQDDGWLMGIKKSDGKKGVFPENFTKRL